jgi:chemotaxis signal transduction protein
MRLQRAVKKSPARHSEDIVVFEVNGARFAIPAAAVDEIRNKESLQPYPAASRTARVRYTVLREDKARPGKNRAAAASSPTHVNRNHEGQTYFVVDASTHFRMPASHTSRVLLLRDYHSAVLVDGIDRMMQASSIVPLPAAFSGEECSWYRGLCLVNGIVIPLVKPESFLSKADVLRLQADLKTHAVMAAKAKGAASA